MRKNLIEQKHFYQPKISSPIMQAQINLGRLINKWKRKYVHCIASFSLLSFSSLIVRQRSNRPNSTYSTNSYQILLNALTANGAVERNEENQSLSSRQRSHQSSIGMQQQYQQQQFNPGLKQVNGKIHIESLSSLSSSSPSSSASSSFSSSHNTQANNNGTLLDTNVRIGMTRWIEFEGQMYERAL